MKQAFALGFKVALWGDRYCVGNAREVWMNTQFHNSWMFVIKVLAALTGAVWLLVFFRYLLGV